MHLNADTKQEGKQKLVLLKQTAADIGVQAEGHEVVDVDDPLGDIVWREQENHITKRILMK